MIQKKIKFIDFQSQYKKDKKKILPILNNVFSSGEYVGGKYVEILENKLCQYFKVKYAVCLNSGTDALVTSLIALGIKRNDEVITVANSFVATAAAIAHIGAIPIFIDTTNDLNMDATQLENVITKKTKAIMPVHLTGRVANMYMINKIAKKYGLKVLEDAAQAAGSKIKGKMAGTLSDVGCFSTHPLKNFNAYGDGGFIITNNKNIYNKIKLMRNHGLENRDNCKKFGYVSRMDNIQAALLVWKLSQLPKIIKNRRRNAKLYFKYLKSKKIILPLEKNYEFNTYHLFIIICEARDKLKTYLKKKGIETSIHYPRPIHLQKCSDYLKIKKGSLPTTEKLSGKILSLPINQTLDKNDIITISNLINNFYKKKMNER